ncbi:hypothetical protein ANANG_G00167330 [Anguilla anguilla]|uniref:Uncharacterized protein n=1 Tax=Anguilla anguilla TaxID=7936 RepID=A0A9D3RX79_ANGAN|nr:hypothetical protein ANANG_G00167330 [Anguilla anguilla]
MKQRPSCRWRARRQYAASASTSRGVTSRKPTTSSATQPPSLSRSEHSSAVPWGFTVEWQRKPKVTMRMAGVSMRQKMAAARARLREAMTMFCAVTSTEHAQQSSELRSSAAGSAPPAAEYGGGTTAPAGVAVDAAEFVCCRWAWFGLASFPSPES